MIDTGIRPAKILLPNVSDMSSWACIACDQFTGEKEYWDELKKQVEGKRTTLDLILPEIYLDDNADSRIEKINANIKRYLKEGVFTELEEGFILTVRKTPFVEKRIGIVGAIDLEKYEYSQKSSALIRSTEGTIEERIPPRLKIRKNADVEFPHIMVLYDDEKKEIAETLYKERKNLKKLYDFDLNMGGGKIEGYFIDDVKFIERAFGNLLEEKRLIKKYGTLDKFCFAVGDGNHSLATAKAHWNTVKESLTKEEIKTHPARYALCEFVNIYDSGIYFEPIHRYVYNVDKNSFLKGLNEIEGINIRIYDGEILTEKSGKCNLPESISAVDTYVKSFIDKNGGKVDYIHGDENLKKLVKGNSNSIGILFDKLDKKDLFCYVSKVGAFPRKTFSMGEGIEKRYYLEGRRITK